MASCRCRDLRWTRFPDVAWRSTLGHSGRASTFRASASHASRLGLAIATSGPAEAAHNRVAQSRAAPVSSTTLAERSNRSAGVPLSSCPTCVQPWQARIVFSMGRAQFLPSPTLRLFVSSLRDGTTGVVLVRVCGRPPSFVRRGERHASGSHSVPSPQACRPRMDAWSMRGAQTVDRRADRGTGADHPQIEIPVVNHC